MAPVNFDKGRVAFRLWGAAHAHQIDLKLERARDALCALASSGEYSGMITRNEDIQVLRSIAVSLVVLFHSGAIPVPAGYLGVDVFFVISGFLITSHIIRDVDKKIFSL